MHEWDKNTKTDGELERYLRRHAEETHEVAVARAILAVRNELAGIKVVLDEIADTLAEMAPGGSEE